MSRRIKQWKAELRKIKAELPPDLRAASRRILRNQRSHARIDPDYQIARRIRTEALKREMGRG